MTSIDGTAWPKGKHELLLNSSSWLKNTSNKENKGGKVDWGLTDEIFAIKHWYKCWENFGKA